LSLDEYLAEALTLDLDPAESAKSYVEFSKALLSEAREELRKGNVRQAAEKLWGSAALAVKAYAISKEGRRLKSHSELWLYKDVLIRDLGEWVYETWMTANGMHTCFYEEWCTSSDVEKAVEKIEKLVAEISKRVEHAPNT